jgi:repressor LexA
MSEVLDFPAPAVSLSARQRDIVEFIRDFTEWHGYPPSVREIAQHTGLASTSSVHYQVQLLVRLGVVVRDPSRSRAITLTEKAA